MSLEKQLARLRGETIKTSSSSSAPEAKPVVDPNENHEIRAWVRKYIQEHPDRPGGLDGPDWKPRDPVEWQNDWYAKFATQPEPPRMDLGGRPYTWDDFRIGRIVDRDTPARAHRGVRYCHREAIPKPKFKNPGQPATPEMWHEFWREENLWFDASLKLGRIINLIRSRETDPDYFNTPSMFLREELAQLKEFLAGVWAGKGLKPPTDEEIEKWVFAERYKPEIKPGYRMVVFTDIGGGNKIYELEEETP